MSAQAALSSDAHPRIAVVIVNYRTASLALDAAASVLREGDQSLLDGIYILDNGSPGAEAQILQEGVAALKPEGTVELVLQADNHGFGKGNNAVFDLLRAAPPDFVLLLNPDAAFKNDVLTHLSETLTADAKIGCVGAGIDGPDDTPVTSAFRFPNLTNTFVDTFAFGPLSRRLPGVSMVLPPSHPAGPVDWVAGAAVMFRWSALEECGFFDPDFFLYEEEVELIWRLRSHGWRCHFNPEGRVRHLEGVATQINSHDARAKARPSYWYQSQKLFLQKTRSRGGAVLFALVRFKAAMLHRILRTLTRKPSDLPQAFLADYWAHVLRPLLAPGTESRQ